MCADPAVVQRKWVEAMIHLKFVCSLYKKQVEAGRYFLHEHPSGATSWAQKCIVGIQQLPNVQRIANDQCQFGQEIAKGEPVEKPTDWMSNCQGILKQFRVRCLGRGGECSRKSGGSHAPCSGKVARDAAVYPFQLCKAILSGLKNQLVLDGRLERSPCGILNIFTPMH